MVDLLHLGAASTHTLFLLYVSHGGSPSYFFKLLTKLWRAGFLSKLAPPTSAALEGSIQDVWMLENGLAGAVLDAGKPLELLDEKTAAFFRQRAEADRQLVLSVLSKYIPDTEFLSDRLKAHAEQGRNLVLSLHNFVGHALKNSEYLAAFMYAARMNGYTVAALHGDKQTKFPVTMEEDGKRVKKTCQPDAFIVIERDGDRQAFAIETETGTSAPNQILAKVAQWSTAVRSFYERNRHGHDVLNRDTFQAWVNASARVTDVGSFRIVFYAPGHHLTKIHRTIADDLERQKQHRHQNDTSPVYAKLFATVSDDLVHTSFPSEVFRNNTLLENGDSLLEHYRTLFCRDEIRGIVAGKERGTGRPIVEYGRLLSPQPA